ncbi:MAG: hypothetical protein SFU98_17980 [Leptospiraceae bacterium]|nr:hypothetical protein [Leptospiraceae bacterium]
MMTSRANQNLSSISSRYYRISIVSLGVPKPKGLVGLFVTPLRFGQQADPSVTTIPNACILELLKN